MLNPKIRKKLETIVQIPPIPYVISEVLKAVDNSNIAASSLASIIERDQALTAKVLTVANSPFYGFPRKISTIDLAIVILGMNSIREIVLSLIIQKFFVRRMSNIFDIRSFWDYSVFCGACSRFLARKLGYRLAGEAFVAGLMHDIGILILIQNFTAQFKEILSLQSEKAISFVDAEKISLESTHCELGVWIAEKWNLPSQLCDSIQYHHSSYQEVQQLSEKKKSQNSGDSSSLLDNIDQPLTLIVSMSEWFAQELGFKGWAMETNYPSPLYLAIDIIEDIKQDDLLEPGSVLESMKQEILEEYEKASIFHEIAK
jgi:HD-like signal output (HDOD) protein